MSLFRYRADIPAALLVLLVSAAQLYLFFAVDSHLAALGGVALLFGMAQGTTKKLEGARNQGWYIVDLDTIVLDELAENDPLLTMARTQVGQAWGAEYAQQMLAAMRAEVGVEKNDNAIAAVRRQLLGETN